MNKSYFEILRPGINTTIQDEGRYNLYHIGISVSGAIDQRNYKLANSLVGNNLDEAVIEFAYQGPHLNIKGHTMNPNGQNTNLTDKHLINNVLFPRANI